MILYSKSLVSFGIIIKAIGINKNGSSFCKPFLDKVKSVDHKRDNAIKKYIKIGSINSLLIHKLDFLKVSKATKTNRIVAILP